MTTATAAAPATMTPASPTTAPDTSGPDTSQTDAAAATTATTTALPQDSVCYDEGNDGAGNFDLVEAYIGRITNNGGYVFNAVALGPDWEGRDWGYSFDLDGLTYVVVAGMYSDGSLNTFVIGAGTPDDNVIADEDSFVSEGRRERRRCRRLAPQDLRDPVRLEGDLARRRD